MAKQAGVSVVGCRTANLGFWLLIALLFWVGPIPSSKAAELPFAYSISPHKSPLADPLENLSQFLGTEPTWKFSDGKAVNLLYQQTDVWLKIAFPIAIEASGYPLLEVGWPFLDVVEAIWVPEKGIEQARVIGRAGDHRPVSERFLQHRVPVFPVHEFSDQAGVLYVRIQSTSSIMLTVSVFTSEDYFQKETKIQAIMGGFLGIMLVMALYNLGVWLYVRETRYLYYVGYTIAISIYEATLPGIGNQWLWGDWVWFSDHSLAISVLVTYLTATLFVRELLELPERNPPADKLITVIIYCYGLGLVIALLVPEGSIARIGQAVGILVTLMAFGLGIIEWRKENPAAKYFTLAWSLLLLGTCTYTMMLLGYLPKNLFTETVQAFGISFEVVVLSFALGDRMNRERSAARQATEMSLHLATELNKAHEEKIQAQEQANIHLERLVDERTRELKSALDELSEANRKLQELSNTDQLTGLRNRRYFDSVFPEEFKRSLRQRQPLAILVVDIDYFKKINDTYGHLFGDECLQRVGDLLKKHSQRPGDTAVRYGGEEFVLLLPNTNESGANQVAENLRTEVAALEIRFNNQIVPVTISVGVVAKIPDETMTAEELLDQADQALYQAKANGRNRVEVA